jgi:hypothetical protein
MFSIKLAPCSFDSDADWNLPIFPPHLQTSFQTTSGNRSPNVSSETTSTDGQWIGHFPPTFPALSLTPRPTQYEMKRTYLPRYPITPPICPSAISSEPHRDNGSWIARSNFSMASLLVNRGNRYRDLITWGVHERWMRENFRWTDAEAYG